MGSKSTQTVTILNPFGFAVTVIRVTVEGCDFAMSGAAVDRVAIPAQGQLILAVMFEPTQHWTCSGILLLEFDSASRRFKRVPLKGRGI